MSNYFQVLKRIEQDRSGRRPAPAPDDVAAAEQPTTAAHHATTAAHRATTAHPATTAAHAATPPPATVATPEAPASGVMPPVGAAPATRALRALSAAPSPAPVAPVHPVAPPPVAPIPSLATARPASRADTVPPPEPRHARPAPTARRAPAPLSDESERGIATLFDKIRALASGRATRTLVFADAAASDSVHLVSDGLARHASRHGMRTFVAELRRSEHGAVVVPRTADEVLAIDLNGGAAPGELNGWVDRIADACDLVIIEGPPLADSIDAALLACACDGLVIVADAEVTPRAALQTAAERAHISGCRTLGVVMTGTRQRIPHWMQRLLGGSDRRGRRDGDT